jgi:molecular chaperone GrpE
MPVSPIDKVEGRPEPRETLRRRRRMLAARGALRQAGRRPPAVDPEYLAQVEAKVTLLAGESTALREAVARQRAEFDNYRRRAAKEKEQVREVANERILAELLPVIDNFDRALASSAQANDAVSIRTGIEMVAKQLAGILQAEGLTRIEPAGEPFDPTAHEAIAVEERDDVPDQHIAEVLLPGFRYRDRVIRPAMVKVARHAAKDAREPAPAEERAE